MRVGFLHLGPPGHGVRRYGEILAEQARRDGVVEVLEQTIEGEAAAGLAGADVVQLQYGARLWGAGWDQLGRLREFLDRCPAPTVATLHDVVRGDPFRGDPVGRVRRTAAAVVRWLRADAPRTAACRLLRRRCRGVTVFSGFEAARVAGRGAPVEVIPMYVPPRPRLPPRGAAREALGFGGAPVVTVLGFIHRRKGQDLLVDALPELPDDAVAVLAGAPTPGGEGFASQLMDRARRRGVADRVRLTGWLEAPELERYLAATDVAACPFRFVSGSASLSDWLSVGRPVVCSALPPLVELGAMVPGAIRTFEPFTPSALAAAVSEVVGEAGDGRWRPAAVPDVLTLAAVWRRHLELYRRVLGS